MFIKARCINNSIIILNIDTIECIKSIEDSIDDKECLVRLIDGSRYYLGHSVEEVANPISKQIVTIDISKKSHKTKRKGS